MAFSGEAVATFLAVLDRGSFSAAARALGRVPSAVSMAIANLEAELDLVLFDRSGREPRPTAAARALEPSARRAAAALRGLDAQALALHAGLEERLTLGVAAEVLSAGWNAPLARLAEEFPALMVDVVSGTGGDLTRRLRAGEVDLALIFERPGLDENEAFQEFGQEIFVAVAAPFHRLAAGPDRPRMEDLIETRQIAVASRDTADSRVLLSREVWHTDNHLAALGLVRAGLGWGFLPRALIQPLAEAGAVTEIAFENISNELSLWIDLVWRRDRPLGLGARRYVELIRAGRLAGRGR
ncbi:LysR family transcriptional regulator [Amaricoccus solimangrovi]|uniref:LysR family transcriptional regulator n=1 Tax=Amaricoccus solimangrovi TaxID=2589815 RepID=A0A501X0U1_9RHOB|nr:LysR family transcriptional regulator [Amaricoccus solimangrovi]TPE52636.1 LysR family transcriptional regulator [Amaricoccus solimangrovi]